MLLEEHGKESGVLKSFLSPRWMEALSRGGGSKHVEMWRSRKHTAEQDRINSRFRLLHDGNVIDCRRPCLALAISMNEFLQTMIAFRMVSSN